MLIRKVLGGSAVSIVLALGGCGLFFGDDGIFRDRADDYLKARSVDPIKIPSDSQGERIGQLFVIPSAGNIGGHSSAEFTVPKPSAPEKIAEQVSQVKIQKLGERRWIAISKSPAEAWPSVRDFLLSKSMMVVDQNPTMGILDAVSGMDRYRIQLENGLSPRSTEIHIVQMSAQPSVVSGSQDWPERSADADREASIVKELAEYLASNPGSQASMMAQNIGNKAPRVTLMQSPQPALHIQVDFARAWASVSGALSGDGYRVDSANREQGQWLISVSSDGDDEKDVVQYRVQLQRLSDEKMQVTVRSRSDETLSDSEADTLLRHIWDHLL